MAFRRRSVCLIANSGTYTVTRLKWDFFLVRGAILGWSLSRRHRWRMSASGNRMKWMKMLG